MAQDSFGASEIGGIVPPIPTPFTASGEVDESGFRAVLGFMAASGAHGVAVGGSTGEGHALDGAECRRLLEIAVAELGGTIPVVAGIIVDSTRQAIQRAREAEAAGAAALQITPVHYLFRPDDDAMLAHFRAVADAVSTPIVIYNVVPWNYLSPALLTRIMREVPGVVGVKQSAGDLKLLADLMTTTPAHARILSAVDALLYPSYALGAHGAIAAILAAAPKACVAQWDAVQAGDHRIALRLHERLLALWNAMLGDNLPACVKAALELQGVPAGLPRAPIPPATPAQRTAIEAALRKLEV